MTQKDKDYVEVLEGATRVVDTMTIQGLLTCPEFKLAMDIRGAVNNLRMTLGITFQSPWWNWWNQIDRSTLSIVGNIAESIGRGRGHAISAYLIAQGEAFETMTLSCGKGNPPEAKQIFESLVYSLIERMNQRLKEICDGLRSEVEAKYATEEQPPREV